MDCRQFLERLSDYIDGECIRGVREAVEEHRAFCRKCNVIYDSTQRTLRIATEYGTDTYRLPTEVSERLQARLRSWFLARHGDAVAAKS